MTHGPGDVQKYCLSLPVVALSLRRLVLFLYHAGFKIRCLFQQAMTFDQNFAINIHFHFVFFSFFVCQRVLNEEVFVDNLVTYKYRGC